jgi:isopentenyl diphosphate isomerase/L-lactate dehydrogenase-like FMN-dependent dehydrogenase
MVNETTKRGQVYCQLCVDRVLEILQAELKLVMGNCGTRTVADINRAYVATPTWKI